MNMLRIRPPDQLRLVVVFGCLGVAAATRADELRCDFSKGKFDPQSFRLVGEADSKHIRPDGDCLRLTLPAQPASARPTGIGARFGLRGDFEVIGEFEIIQVGEPKNGHGSGLSIYANIDSPSHDAVSIAWLRRPKEGVVFVAHHASDGADMKRQHRLHFVKAQNEVGRLRLERRGDAVVFSAADGASAEFRPIWRTRPAPGDVTSVRFAADNGGAAVPVDVRWRDLALRADRFLHGDSAEGLSTGGALSILGGASIAAAVGLAVLRRRQNRRMQGAPHRS